VTDLFSESIVSQFEQSVCEFLKSIQVQYISNDRSLIAPLELDILIPESNLAIECCGLYWHAERSSNRSRDYHQRKYQLCAEKNIQLITLFEDEWNFQRDQVKNRLMHILQKEKDRIFARKCTVVEIGANESREFLNNYHLQGYIPALHSLALRYQDQTIAVMSFGRPRYNQQAGFELLRFCSSKSIPGAASKLFDYFVKTYHPSSVCSYSDNRWGSGKVYESLGMTKKSSTLGFYYTDYKKRYNRTRFQKHRLVEQGHDPKKSAWQILQEMGYDRIWDCGQSLWIWHQQ
jgi:hypothetical protein